MVVVLCFHICGHHCMKCSLTCMIMFNMFYTNNEIFLILLMNPLTS